jgi:hypothetical protein
MHYISIIATVCFAVILIIGFLVIVGTIFKWKPLIDPAEKTWLFPGQYLDGNYFGKSWVVIHNIIIGLIFILVGLTGSMIGLHRLK